MLQRIQSIFLFLVFILAILVYFTNFSTANIADPNPGSYYLDVTSIYRLTTHTPDVIQPLYWLTLINGFNGILAFFTIFLYKNRLQQIKLSRFGLILTLILIVLIFFYSEQMTSLPGAEAQVNYLWGAILPILQLLFYFMAIRNIKRDEALVRSADRLR